MMKTETGIFQEFPQDWNLLSKINFLQRKIILNSMAYYQYDNSPLSDFFYDNICKQLVILQEEYIKQGKSLIADSEYGYVFYDFDGSTGFHLYKRLKRSDKDWLDLIAASYFSK